MVKTIQSAQEIIDISESNRTPDRMAYKYLIRQVDKLLRTRAVEQHYNAVFVVPAIVLFQPHFNRKFVGDELMKHYVKRGFRCTLEDFEMTLQWGREDLDRNSDSDSDSDPESGSDLESDSDRNSDSDSNSNDSNSNDSDLDSDSNAMSKSESSSNSHLDLVGRMNSTSDLYYGSRRKDQDKLRKQQNARKRMKQKNPKSPKNKKNIKNEESETDDEIPPPRKIVVQNSSSVSLADRLKDVQGKKKN